MAILRLTIFASVGCEIGAPAVSYEKWLEEGLCLFVLKMHPGKFLREKNPTMEVTRPEYYEK